MTTTTAAPVLEIKRLLDASPQRIFDAWMKREEWEAWVGPEGVKCQVPVMEPHVGGRYKIIMTMSDGRTMPVVGTFKTIEAPTHIAFSWKLEGGDDDSLVTISLRAVGNKTEITLRHEGLQTAQNVEGHGKGWNSALNKLEAFIQ
jgi:uncharacterized protein YndB with AHSA1/START domain